MNADFWESKFSSDGAMWKYEPSDSAIKACDLFVKNDIGNILIPGVGYGRNARVFIEAGITVTGIEIAKAAIDLAKSSGPDFLIHHGSVNNMPFDESKYAGIFCYSLIHLLNQPERRRFLQACFNQLNPGGLMVFTVISINDEMYGDGKQVSKNRVKLPHGLKVFFYDNESIQSEFHKFGLLKYQPIDEPIKFAEGHRPLKCHYIICQKP